MEKRTDLRVIKTKRNIHRAFFQLAAKKRDVRRITVKELCALAECGRSTFYLYYPYKDALYKEILETALEEIMSGFEPLPHFVPGSWREVSEEYLRNVLTALYQIKKLFLILPPGSEAFHTFVAALTDRMVNYIQSLTMQMYPIDTHEKQVRINATNRVILAGIINEAVYCCTRTEDSVESVLALTHPLFVAYNEELERILAGE